MKVSLLFAAVFGSLMAVGCGGDSDDDDGGSSGGTSSSDVVNPQPPGQAKVTVDGKELTFTQPGAIACKVSEKEFSFSFRIGDNETTLGGGGVYAGGAWGGEIKVTVANPEGEQGAVEYPVSLPEVEKSALAFDGKSMSYSGPMKKYSQSNRTGADVGVGTVSVTCP